MASSTLYLWIAYIVIEAVKGQGLCGDHLLPSIPDSHITASSSLVPTGGKAYTGPERGRLNTQQATDKNGIIQMGAWAPATDSKGQYIQATFDDLTYVESIITQGQNPSGGFVKLYKIEYTEDGKTWKFLDLASTPGIAEIFKGNSDTNTPVESELDCPLFAKGIRIYPLEWDSHIALRFDVKGCYLDNTAPVFTTPPTSATIPATTTPLTTPLTTTGPFLPGILTPFGGSKSSSSSPVTSAKPIVTGITSPPPTTVNLSSLLVCHAHALLFPLNNGNEPEPELLFLCPPPRAPQFGSIKCDYGIFDMSCTAQCNPGYQFETGARTASVKCDLFEVVQSTAVPKCVRIDTGVVTQPPVTTHGCVSKLEDCFNKEPKDYQYCGDCRQYASCAASGLYVRQCPGISVFDSVQDKCVDHSNTCSI